MDSILPSNASNSTPPSIIKTTMDLEVRFLLYTICGFIVLVSSGITIIIFTCTKEFRTKYAMFNGLAIADFVCSDWILRAIPQINGLSFVTAGIFRSRFLHQGVYFTPITNGQCIWETPWALLMIIAGQLPALLNLCLSLERVVALECGSWYRRVWKESHKHYLVFGCFFLTGANLVFVLLLDQIYTVRNPDRICAVMNSTGIIYGTIHYSLCALVFFACFIMLLIIFRKTNRRTKPSANERKRQLLLQWITGVSVFLVSIPNLVLILNEWKLPQINALVVGAAYCLYALHSSLSLPMYLYFRKDFRKRFLWLFCRYRMDGFASSTPILPSITFTGPKGQTIQVKRAFASS